MKKNKLDLAEILYVACFFLFLFASDLTFIEHGSELSLWLMTFAAVLTISAALFPWLGVRWLRIPLKGSRFGRWAARLFQLASWGAFAAAMIQRWRRNLTPFYWWITFSSLLWALWLVIFIYNRYALDRGDTLNEKKGKIKGFEDQ
jgi:hypothetical protein